MIVNKGGIMYVLQILAKIAQQEKEKSQCGKTTKHSHFELLQLFTKSESVSQGRNEDPSFIKKKCIDTRSHNITVSVIHYSLTTPPSDYCDLLHVPDIVNHRWIWWNWDWVVAVSELSVPGRLLGLRVRGFPRVTESGLAPALSWHSVTLTW